MLYQLSYIPKRRATFVSFEAEPYRLRRARPAQSEESWPAA